MGKIMESLGLLVGHLVGDFILQNDWIASWKSGGPPPTPQEEAYVGSFHGDAKQEVLTVREIIRGLKATAVCLLHCLLYTLAVWGCSWWWMPWWGLVACFTVHFPIDRWRLARKWMSVSGQEMFATKDLSPWSIIVVDNTFHLLTLFAIGVAAAR